jgi:hypothetical protein
VSATIPASGSQTISVTFEPTDAGNFEGRVLIFSNASTDPLVVVLTATASTPVTTPPDTETGIPVDTFSGITLGSPLPRTYTVGTQISFVGAVTDGGIGIVQFRFLPVDTLTNEIDPARMEKVIVGTVENDAFILVISFEDGEEGAYVLNVFGGDQNATTLPSIGSVEGIVVSSQTAEPEPTLLGDINGNGSVDFTDFLQFAGAFGSSVGDSNYVAGADLDGS